MSREKTPQQIFRDRIASGMWPAEAMRLMLDEEIERTRREYSHNPDLCEKIVERRLAPDAYAEKMGTDATLDDAAFLRELADRSDLAGGERTGDGPRQNHSVARRLRAIAQSFDNPGWDDEEGAR